MDWQTKKIKLATGQVEVRTAGKGQNLVILHGWGSSFCSWEKTLVELSSEFRVWMFELPGFGLALQPKVPWGVTEYARWVDEVISKLKFKKVILLGHSNGGRIGIHLTSQKPDWLASLVLINSAGIPAKNNLKKTMFRWLAEWGKKLAALQPLRRFYQPARKLLYRLAREKDYLSAGPLMREVMIRLLAYDASVDAVAIEIPTLIIWGGKDAVTPLWMGKKLNELIKNSRLVIVPGARHGLPIQRPKAVLKEVSRWAKEVK